MKWRKSYLDLILIPSAFLPSIIYHAWLWHKIRSEPYRTIVGVSSAARRHWILYLMKDDEKRNILAIQTIRNEIMGATLMASTSILLCTGLAAMLSSTYSVKKPVGNFVYGAHGDVVIAVKYTTILFLFLLAFIAYSLSVFFLNQVNFLIHIVGGREYYVIGMLEKAFVLSVIGNRIFYTALPLLMWIFGPLLVLFSSFVVVLILYSLDFVIGGERNQFVGFCGEIV